MARRTRMIAVTALLAGALAACNALVGLNEDYRYSPDGGSAANEAGAGEGGDGDADGRDGATTEDAKTDALLLDGAVARFCLRTDAGLDGICEDFELNTSPPNFGWESKTNDHDASIVFADDAGRDHSRGLDVILVQPSGSNSTAWLVKTIPPIKAANTFQHYQVEFDVSVVEVTNMYSSNLGELTFPSSGNAQREFGVGQYGTGASVSRLGTLGTGVPSSKGTNAWLHVQVDVQRADGSASFSKTVTVDGTTVDTGGGIDPGVNPDTDLRLGVFSTAGNSGAGPAVVHAQFDNVVIRRW